MAPSDPAAIARKPSPDPASEITEPSHDRTGEQPYQPDPQPEEPETKGFYHLSCR